MLNSAGRRNGQTEKIHLSHLFFGVHFFLYGNVDCGCIYFVSPIFFVYSKFVSLSCYPMIASWINLATPKTDSCQVDNSSICISTQWNQQERISIQSRSPFPYIFPFLRCAYVFNVPYRRRRFVMSRSRQF